MFLNGLYGMAMIGRIFMDADKGGGSGGGSGGSGTGGGDDAAAKLAKAEADLKAANDKIAALEKSGGGNNSTQRDKKEENDLIEKARLERENAEKTQADTKAIESALKFNLGLDAMLKENKDVFPKEIEGIVAAAGKEIYESAAHKANALKDAMIQSFFSMQANLDLLTSSQKDSIADFLKLAKTVREAKAASIFDSIFEPALETLKRVKKAEQLGKSRAGHADTTTTMDGYKQRLIDGAKKGFLKEKGASK